MNEVTEDKLLDTLDDLLEADQNLKKWNSVRDEAKNLFFAHATASAFPGQDQPSMLLYFSGTHDTAISRAEKHNPGWQAHSAYKDKDLLGNECWAVTLYADPEFTPFEIEHEGYKIARTIVKGSLQLDEEWLAEEDPELLELATFELPWGERIMRPLTTLAAEHLAKLQLYLYNDTPRRQLRITKLKQEEQE